MHPRTASTLLAICLGCLWAGACHAGTFSFTTDKGVYSALPGSKVPVQVYLQEVTGGEAPSILDSEGGLFSSGLRCLPDLPLPEQPASPAALSDIVADAEFTGGSIKNLDPLFLLLADGILADPGPTGETMPDGSRRVHLATLNFTCGSIAGESTSFKITDYDDFGISSDTLTWEGTELDNLIAPGRFTIATAIPEPAGFTILATGLLIFIRRPLRGAACDERPR